MKHNAQCSVARAALEEPPVALRYPDEQVHRGFGCDVEKQRGIETERYRDKYATTGAQTLIETYNQRG